ncbi:putative helicase [Polychytrium aggregatum]|uniref:putative helicase n=1 Tax=Polychytrium aggregatum TaxID=110093 RepID=UPI0022FE1044|nr:putative helicase [Polychytrium aggregatum]KAI9205646.1 putative helicase [Polychytrium aggregatum]
MTPALESGQDPADRLSRQTTSTGAVAKTIDMDDTADGVTYDLSKNQLYLMEREERMKRLHFLLTRTGVYSDWLATKLEARQKEQIAKAARSSEPVLGDGDSSAAPTNVNDPIEPESGQPKRRGRPSKAKTDKDPAAIDAPVVAAKRKPGERQPVLVTGCVMREYQLVGMEWLISLYENGLNGILADEMGLGKTLQTISFFAHLRENKVMGPFLVVSPLSTLDNWVNEIKRFAPSIPVLLYHGDPPTRAQLRKEQMGKFDERFPIIVTSFDISMRDRKHLQRYAWKYIVVDEGHRLKNLNCRLIQELKKYTSANRLLLTGTPLQNNLSELWSLLNFLMPDIFDDLGAFQDLFDFFESNSNEADKEKILDRESKESVVSNLHNILKPFLLRRVKSEVEKFLPPKKEFIVYAPMTNRQKELYSAALCGVSGLRDVLLRDTQQEAPRAVAGNDASSGNDEETVELRTRSQRGQIDRRNYEELSDRRYFASLDNSSHEAVKSRAVSSTAPRKGPAKAISRLNLQNLIMQLRKICNHTYLFDLPDDDDESSTDGDESEQEDEVPVANGRRADEKAEYHDPHHSVYEGSLVHRGEASRSGSRQKRTRRLPEIVATSGKMMLLERMLPKLFRDGHKVLIFSQMRKMLDIIADWCEYEKKWKFCRIDGHVSISDRKKQMDEFNSDPSIKLFLLSTRAGGLGINLTAADTVIIYDSDWNPQMDLQAQDRVHRIGQTKPVFVYRFITTGTVENRIQERAMSKRKLEQLVIHKEHFKGSSSYYKKSTRITNLEDLAMLLTEDAASTESVVASEIGSGAKRKRPDGDEPSEIDLEEMLTEEDLNRMMDRSRIGGDHGSSNKRADFDIKGKVAEI